MTKFFNWIFGNKRIDITVKPEEVSANNEKKPVFKEEVESKVIHRNEKPKTKKPAPKKKRGKK